MQTIIIQLISAFAGSAGFALVFHINRNCILPAAFGGFLSWAVYLLTEAVTGGFMLPCFVGALAAGIWSEAMARAFKKPATVFLISGIIPLIPGSTCYATMNSLVNGDILEGLQHGNVLVLSMVFIALGTSVVSAFLYTVQCIRKDSAARKGC